MLTDLASFATAADASSAASVAASAASAAASAASVAALAASVASLAASIAAAPVELETLTVTEPATDWLAVARFVPVVHENLTSD